MKKSILTFCACLLACMAMAQIQKTVMPTAKWDKTRQEYVFFDMNWYTHAILQKAQTGVKLYVAETGDVQMEIQLLAPTCVSPHTVKVEIETYFDKQTYVLSSMAINSLSNTEEQTFDGRCLNLRTYTQKKDYAFLDAISSQTIKSVCLVFDGVRQYRHALSKTEIRALQELCAFALKKQQR